MGRPGGRLGTCAAHRPSCRAVPVPRSRGQGTAHRPLLSPGRWPHCLLPGWGGIGASRVKGREVSLGNVRPHVLAFLPAQAPTPEVKAAWVSEIRKVLTSQLQACRGRSRGHGRSQPGSSARLCRTEATPKPGAPGGAAASQVKSVTCFCVPSLQKPASTVRWSSPRACLCPHRPAPGEGAAPAPVGSRVCRHHCVHTAGGPNLLRGFGSLWVCLQAPECPLALCAGGPSPPASLREGVSGPTPGAGRLLPSVFRLRLFPGTVSAAHAAGAGDGHRVSVTVAP